MTSIGEWFEKMNDAFFNTAVWGESDFDTDHPDCPECGGRMDFCGHDDDGAELELGDGHWQCSECGYTIYEDDF